MSAANVSPTMPMVQDLEANVKVLNHRVKNLEEQHDISATINRNRDAEVQRELRRLRFFVFMLSSWLLVFVALLTVVAARTL